MGFSSSGPWYGGQGLVYRFVAKGDDAASGASTRTYPCPLFVATNTGVMLYGTVDSDDPVQDINDEMIRVNIKNGWITYVGRSGSNFANGDTVHNLYYRILNSSITILQEG